MFNWLKRKLGIVELASRVNFLEKERAGLEGKVIQAEKSLEVIRASVSNAELAEEAREFLSQLNVQLSNGTANEALKALEASELVRHYRLARFVPPMGEAYPASIISFKEFQEHPEKYFHKLTKGVFGFPLGLNFSGVNSLLQNNFGTGNIQDYLSRDMAYSFSVDISRMLGTESRRVGNLLAQTIKIADLVRYHDGRDYVSVDPLDFLANYDNLSRLIMERPDLRPNEKKKWALETGLVKFSYLTALEVIGTSRIKDPAELLSIIENGATKPSPLYSDGTIEEELAQAYQLKEKIRASLLVDLKGTSSDEVYKLLPIRSKERFRELASLRTAEILSIDKERKGLTEKLGKEISDYSIGESIILACYFARNVIQQYESLDEGVKRVLSGETSDKISGKCTDYTGLALHYLREYLVPLHPEKFKNWSFGFDSDRIGDYKHCYMKVVHVLPEGTDVYFLDPTLLASKGFSALKTPEEVLKAVDTSKLPLLIQREAEDLLGKPIKK